jgi:RNA methyltransferase, TrmH family
VRIDSPSNPRIRAAIELRQRRERERTGLTLVEGVRESARAIEGGVEVRTAFICDERLSGDQAATVRAALRAAEQAALRAAEQAARGWATHGPEIVDVGPRAFERLAFGDRAEGIVLVVQSPAASLEALHLPSEALVVVTEDVEKPGNLGAIIRSADGAGASAVVAVGGTDLYNPNVVRASVGTAFRVPLAAAPGVQVRRWLADAGLRTVVSRVDADALYADADLRGPLAIVLGSEAEGLSELWRGEDVEAVRLPMLGAADSLNVSATAAILLYEAWRQRRPPAIVPAGSGARPDPARPARRRAESA